MQNIVYVANRKPAKIAGMKFEF